MIFFFSTIIHAFFFVVYHTLSAYLLKKLQHQDHSWIHDILDCRLNLPLLTGLKGEDLQPLLLAGWSLTSL